jgi:hypothetical protein
MGEQTGETMAMWRVHAMDVPRALVRHNPHETRGLDDGVITA